MTEAPHPTLVALSDLLVGTWRVEGPEIEGRADYRTRNEGLVLVAFVDFRVGATTMRVIQHIAHDAERDVLLAHYLDTMGDRATYLWSLEGRTLVVRRDDQGADGYFEATLAEDRSRYAGTWHYSDGPSEAEEEVIVYTREDGGG